MLAERIAKFNVGSWVASVRKCGTTGLGYGVFVNRDAPDRTVLCSIPCDIVHDPGQTVDRQIRYIEVPGREEMVALPTLPSDDRESWSSETIAPIGRWVNHATNPDIVNAGIYHSKTKNNKTTYHVCATRAIGKGSQVLVDYGPDSGSMEKVDAS